MKTALAFLAATGLANIALAQERRPLQMPAHLQRPVNIVPQGAGEAEAPPGLSRMLQEPATERDATVIASGGLPPPARLPTFDFYNNLTRSTVEQFRQGQFPTGIPGDSFERENRWTMPPSVGVVVQKPVGTPNVNGAAPASVGVNAGPGVDPYGATNGVSINARVRMPFGR